MTVYLQQAAALCALGNNTRAIEEKLFSISQSPLIPSTEFSPANALPLGYVDGGLPDIAEPLLNTRNNRLLLAALQQLQADIDDLKQRVDTARIGVIIGSSTSGIREGEQAVAYHQQVGNLPGNFDYSMQEIGAPALFVQQYLQVSGPAWTISTACTSSAKALASASRLIELGVCDAVIAGGADTLCRLTVEGFSALSAVSHEQCLPFSANRKGINIGEGAALFVVTREPAAIALQGYGESSDAHHISAPHPEGLGAVAAMEQALRMAGKTPADIHYLNLHGTATEQNDSMEARAVHQVFGEGLHCGSTKALTGHTLGAAGALEALFCWLCLKREDGQLPVHLWDGQYDEQLPSLPHMASRKLDRPVSLAMSNSFAFGGNNISLLMEKLS